MKTIIGFFDNVDDIRKVINELKDSGIKDISYITSNRAWFDVEENDSAGDLAKDAGEGGAIGAISGLAIAALAMTGIGPLFVAGPILAILGTGAVSGGIVGALAGWGVGADKAKDYETRIREGEAMVSAEFKEEDEDKARSLFKKCNAKDIEVYAT